MSTRIQIRRDSTANWSTLNPVLAEGEFGYELDTKKTKLGDGTTRWTDLAYREDTSEVDARLATKVSLASVDVPNGVAGTDSAGMTSATTTSGTATFVVASASAMLALSAARKGDIAVRTDTSESYRLTNSTPANSASWTRIAAGGLDKEAVEDITGSLIVAAANSGITVVYSDNGSGAGVLTIGTNSIQIPSITTASPYNVLQVNAGKTGVEWVNPSESVQDVVGALIQAGSGIGVAYDDTNNKLTISATGSSSPTPSATVAYKYALGRFYAGLRNRDSQPVVMIYDGSSTTAGSGATSESKRYVNILHGYIQRAFPLASGATQPSVLAMSTATAGTKPLSVGINTVNNGKGGTKSADFISDADVTAYATFGTTTGVTVIQHMVGSNDWSAGVTPSTFKTNLATWIGKIKTAFANANKPLVQVIVATYGRNDSTATGTIVAPWSDYIKAMREIAEADLSNIAYFDISQWYANAGVPGNDTFDILISDNVHQNDKGYDLMADLLRDEYNIPVIPVGASTTPVTPTPAPVFTPFTSDSFGVASTSMSGQSTDAYDGGTAKAWQSPTPASYQKVNNTLTNSSTRSSIETLGMDIGSTDQAITLYVPSGGLATSTAWIDFRSASVSNTSISTYRVAMSPTLNNMQLGIRLSGASNITIGDEIPVNWTGGGGNVVRVECRGTVLKLYLNGTLVQEITDTRLSTGTFFRLTSTQTTVFTYEDIHVSTIS